MLLPRSIASLIYLPNPQITQGSMTSRTGKTYVITGGISGLGLAAAKLLYGQGANGTKAWYLVRCC